MCTKKIFVIDDEPDTVAYLSVLLEDNGYDVISAHNVEEAMALLKDNSPDLIMVDVMMPGASGLNFVVQLRQDPRHDAVPVIMVTGKAEVFQDKGRSYLDRYNVRPPEGILEKPFEHEVLLRTVERLLERPR